jgi:hypothetical protein
MENHAIQVRTVLRGGAAEQAGFAAGDEWLGIVCGTAAGATAWRIQRLEDLGQYAAPGTAVTALVSRDRRILHLNLQLPRAVTTWRLSARDPALMGTWLGGA